MIKLDLNLILIIATLILVVIVGVVLYFWQRDVLYWGDLDDDAFTYKIKRICRGNTISEHIRTIAREEIERTDDKDKIIKANYTIDYNELEKWIRNVVRSELNVVKNVKQVEKVPGSVKENESVLYASCVNESDDIFYSVTTTPNSETIYLLKVNKENHASFQVYDKMLDKVKEEQDHLKGGCDVENLTTGSITSMQTKVLGQAVRQDNGKWKVTKKANVIFK